MTTLSRTTLGLLLMIMGLVSCEIAVPGTVAAQEPNGLGAAGVAAILKDTKNSPRYSAIRSLEPRIRFGLSGTEVASIIGETSGSWRVKIIQLLASHARQGLEANEATAILSGTSNGSRNSAISALAPRIKFNLDGFEFAQIVADRKFKLRFPWVR